MLLLKFSHQRVLFGFILGLVSVLALMSCASSDDRIAQDAADSSAGAEGGSGSDPEAGGSSSDIMTGDSGSNVGMGGSAAIGPAGTGGTGAIVDPDVLQGGAAGGAVAGTDGNGSGILQDADVSSPTAGDSAVTGPATCSEAVSAYTIGVTTLDPSIVPAPEARSWSGTSGVRASVAVDPPTSRVYVGITRQQGDALEALIATENGSLDNVIVISNAVMGAVAATNDGVGALIYDPNTTVDDRVWAAVKRFKSDGAELFSTELFHSPNLDDVGTKGAPANGRLGYIAQTDQLVPYFGHTQRYDDGVRHQGGYLATLDSSGTQNLISGWFGSHNLDQRLLVVESRAAVIGLGDAYPEGIFIGFTDSLRLRPQVIYQLAAAGNGATNGKLGGMVDFDDVIVVSFITDRSIPQDLDAGTWPDIDQAISNQIREAAQNGTDAALLLVPKAGLPGGDLTPVWFDLTPASGARIGSLKSVRYGTGDLILVAWSELTGSLWSSTSTYHTMVIDHNGAICQDKQSLDAAHAFTAGDDLVRRPDGAIVWANGVGGRVNVVTLTP